MKGTALVVGAGIFGAVIGRSLALAGWDVQWVDDKRQYSGSKPSACLMKPSWFSSMGRVAADQALEQLGKIHRVRTIDMQIWPSKITASAFWIPRDEILDVKTINAKVVHVDAHQVLLRDWDDPLEPDLVVVAAGYWCRELMGSQVEARKGIAFRWIGAHLDANVVHPWAPYKQIVGFNEGGRVWGGDGSAIKPENWDVPREEASRARVSKFLGLEPTAAFQDTGLRPYWKGDAPCLLEKRKSGLWIATGGGKNGTIAAGWAARQIVEATS